MKRIAAVIAVVVTTLPALAAWTVRPDTVKIVVKKATRGGSTASAHAAVRHHSASIVTENASGMVIQVPRARAAQLKADLLANADSVDIREELDVIGFRAHPIDVRSGAQSYPTGWSVSDAAHDRDAFVIQFAAAPQTEWIEAMASAGLRVLTYVPENAYVVFGRAVDVETIRDRYPVQFVSRHQPAHRISPELRTSAARSVAATVVIANVPEASGVLAFLQVHGRAAGEVTDAGDRSLHRMTLDTATLDELAALPAVLWIEHAPEMRVSGEREVYLSTGDTRTTISGTLLRPSWPADYRAWLSGKGVGNYASTVKVAILDTGFDDGTASSPHFDFRNSATGSFVELVDYTTRQIAPMSDCYGHGTAVAAVISGNADSTYGTTTRDIGTDGQYLMGLGIAPAIPLVSGRVFNYNANVPFPRGFDGKPWTTIYPDLALRQVRITSASINDSTLANAGRYTADTQLLDRIVRKVNSNDTGEPMAIYSSAGNRDSYSPASTTETKVQPPASAKNLVSAGGSESYNLISSYALRDQYNAGVHSDNGFDHFALSAYGTADQRFKPDVVAPASAVEASRTSSTTDCHNTSLTRSIGPHIDTETDAKKQHIWSRGTSFAAPAAAGNAALLYTWFKNKTTLAPSPAMLKAMQITLAQPLATLSAAPETKQGFGKVDLTQAFKTDGRYVWSDQTSATLLTPSSSLVFLPSPVSQYTIKDTTRPVRVTLVWTDRAGDPAAAKALVNDLHLIVQGTSGLTAVGNNIDPATRRSRVYYNQTLPYDRTNNVEQVILNSTDVGRYITIQVWGETITGDAINPWNGTTPRQDFALFIENVIGQ